MAAQCMTGLEDIGITRMNDTLHLGQCGSAERRESGAWFTCKDPVLAFVSCGGVRSR